MNAQDPAQSPLRSNVDIENAAIQFVIRVEEQEGRTPRDTRDQGALADVESDDRIIEVKAAGTTSRGFEVWLEPGQYEAAQAHPHRFWLYLVENIRQGDPSKFRLLRFGGERLHALLCKAKERHYYTLPVPVAVYDEGCQGVDGNKLTSRRATTLDGTCGPPHSRSSVRCLSLNATSQSNRPTQSRAACPVAEVHTTTRACRTSR